MKKLSLIFVLIISAAVVSFAASEDVDVYTYLYNAALNNSTQLGILQHMAEARISGAGEFYATALRKLLADYKNIKDSTELNAANDQAILLSSLLGSEKYSKAADDLWRVQTGFTAPLVRAEALMSLGKIRAVNYLPQVIRVLETLNTSPTPDRLNGERIAFGAIISLEKYQDASGYLPVFFAATGWYSDRIKKQAAQSLPLIAKDPTAYMLEVVRGAGYDYPTKFTALKTIEAAQIDNKSKASVAVAALDEGWKGATTDVQLKLILADMRKMAIKMINRYKTDDNSVYPLLEKSYTNGEDPQEKLEAIAALISLGTEESTQRLVKFLTVWNDKRESNNIKPEDEAERYVKDIVKGIGTIGRLSGAQALIRVKAIPGWNKAVKDLAEEARKKLR